MSEKRKNDHIALTFQSQANNILNDDRFFYEPLTGAAVKGIIEPFPFLGKTMRVPVWVSSMTGGSAEAGTINRNLARACAEFGMGMGLGSCRVLLEKPGLIKDFDMREIIGDDLPFYANIGIAQVEEMLRGKRLGLLEDLVGMLKADGLIIHVNPIQEWIQNEGDVLKHPPAETLEAFLSLTKLKIIVKEVGQGMGPESIARVLALPVEAFEFAAFGGTNFAMVELARRVPQNKQIFEPLAWVGHSAAEMLETVNSLVRADRPIACRQVIISGGIHSFLDGYYFLSKSLLPAIYGQASGFLRHARGEYGVLQDYVAGQIAGLRFARAYLQLRNK
jgi:isopentenyl-diphosphate delta-isomerase